VVIEFLKNFYTLFFVWLACLTAIFTFRKTLSLSYRGFILLIILLSILETIANAIGFFGRMKNHFVWNILYAFQLTLVPYFFKSWLQRPLIKKIITVYIYVFPLFVLINTLLAVALFCCCRLLTLENYIPMKNHEIFFATRYSGLAWLILFILLSPYLTLVC